MCLVKFEGKVAEKLIDVVSKGIGTVYKPRAMRKEADAEAYRQETLANAQAKTTLIEGEAKLELYERAKNRLILQEINRQENIEEIIEKSIPLLNENVDDTEVDVDWRTRFFKKAQDVSNADIQDIWARILAEEVSSPGKTSLRTLDIVSNLSKVEADKFQLACSLTSENESIWKINGKSAFDDFDFNYSDLMLLREAGLLHDSDILNTTMSVIPQLEGSVLYIGNDAYSLKDKNNPQLEKHVFTQVSLTQAGTELCRLIHVPKNLEYIKMLIAHFEEKYIVTKLDLNEN